LHWKIKRRDDETIVALHIWNNTNVQPIRAVRPLGRWTYVRWFGRKPRDKLPSFTDAEWIVEHSATNDVRPK
jgi:hypothetical protein